jgi:hypothetical protein
MLVFLSFSSLALASTVIGHPTGTSIAHDAGVDILFAEVPVHTMTVDRCDDTFDTYEVGEVLDLVAGDPLTLPEGDICGVRLDLAGRMHVYGQDPAGASGGTFSLSLAVGQVFLEVDPALTVSGGTSPATAVRFADSSWLASLPLTPGAHLHVNPSHPQHGTVRDGVRDDSAVEQ